MLMIAFSVILLYVVAHICISSHWVLLRTTSLISPTGCRNLVPAPPHTASDETLVCASRSLPKGPVVGGLIGLFINYKLGSGPLKPTNGFVSGKETTILRDIWWCGIRRTTNYKTGWIEISRNLCSNRIEVLSYLTRNGYINIFI